MMIVSPEDSRWETVRSERTVLAVVRTVVSAVRVIDALSVFSADFRVGVRFAFDDSSAFSTGVRDVLDAHGVQPVPWPDAARSRYDLALMASENVELAPIDSPIVVLPHGVGFNRYVPDSQGPGERLAGVVPVGRLAGKRAFLAVPHPDQQLQLRPGYPEAAARCVVVGDMVFDELVASLSLRDSYRRVLGIRAGERLVVVTSTWGAGSLMATWPELPARLLTELPADEYRVMLVQHPNIRAWRDEYQLSLWLANAYQAGLTVMPPAAGWQAALIAADAVIGDHGSVTMYGAALDRPVLLTGDQRAARVVAGTPPDLLAGMAPRLDPGAPLAMQVEMLIDSHAGGRFGALAHRMFARQGQAALALRDLLYEQLDLPVPGVAPAIRTVNPVAGTGNGPALSHVVYATAGPDQVISLQRFPAAAAGTAPASRPADAAASRHLCVDELDPDRRRPPNAAVIVRRAVTSPAEAASWVDATLSIYPGCRVAAAALYGGCLAGLRDGTRIRARMPRGADPALAASAVYACWRSGGQADGPLTIRAGRISITTTLTRVS